MESQWSPRTERMVRQVRRIVNPPRQQHPNEDALLISVLAAFPDRVARRREAAELQLAAGGPALLAPSSTVTANQFLVAVEAEDRRDQRAPQKMPLVRIASGIEPEWLLDLFPERIRETATVEWNRAAERVEAVSALMFDQIAIESHRAGARSSGRRRAPHPEGHGSRPRALRGPRGNRGLPGARRISPLSTALYRRLARMMWSARCARSPPASRVSPSWKPPRAMADC